MRTVSQICTGGHVAGRSAVYENQALLLTVTVLIRDPVCIGNHMISSAVWDKSARVNFSKANQIARARRASAMCSL